MLLPLASLQWVSWSIDSLLALHALRSSNCIIEWLPCTDAIRARQLISPARQAVRKGRIFYQCFFFRLIWQNYTPVIKLYSNFNKPTFTFPQLHIYQILKFGHKWVYHQNKLSFIFSNYLIRNYMFHKLYITPATGTHSSLKQRSITFEGSRPWNSLTDKVKSVISSHLFAKHLKRYMIQCFIIVL